MRKSEFYHLLIQRLLRFVAREAKGTPDGKKLGKSARRILSSMLPGLEGLDQLVSEPVAEYILTNAGSLFTSPGVVSIEAISKLLKMGEE
jgi:hypothetical protein